MPNIFPSDEKVAICESTRPFARAVYGKAAGDMSPNDLYAFFLSRVRQVRPPVGQPVIQSLDLSSAADPDFGQSWARPLHPKSLC